MAGSSVALLLQHRADHVEGLTVVRLAGDGVAELLQGFIGTAGLPQHHAQRERRFRQRSDRGARPCAAPPPPRRNRPAVSAPARGCRPLRRSPGSSAEQRAELGGRLRQVALLHQRRAEIQPRRQVVRLRRDQPRSAATRRRRAPSATTPARGCCARRATNRRGGPPSRGGRWRRRDRPSVCSAMPRRVCATASDGFSRTAARSSSIAACEPAEALQRHARDSSGTRRGPGRSVTAACSAGSALVKSRVHHRVAPRW